MGQTDFVVYPQIQGPRIRKMSTPPKLTFGHMALLYLYVGPSSPLNKFVLDFTCVVPCRSECDLKNISKIEDKFQTLCPPRVKIRGAMDEMFKSVF